MNMNYKKYKNLEAKGTSQESESSVKDTITLNATSNNKENDQDWSEGKIASNNSNLNNISHH